jgi:hypothetical protein
LYCLYRIYYRDEKVGLVLNGLIDSQNFPARPKVPEACALSIGPLHKPNHKVVL